MRVFLLLGVVCLAASAEAAQTKASFGVSVTVVYNCAMDMSKLTPAQRKIVEDYCSKKAPPAPQGSTAPR